MKPIVTGVSSNNTVQAIPSLQPAHTLGEATITRVVIVVTMGREVVLDVELEGTGGSQHVVVAR